ncbi:hypothetical protein GCM10023223_52190 [Stackebrandtia albiflava]
MVGVIGLVALTALVMGMVARRRRHAEEALEAHRTAAKWCGLLHGQLASLRHGGDPVASRALEDAREHFDMASHRLSEASTAAEYHAVQQAAVVGLRYIGVARARLGLVAGPQGPPPSSADGRPMYEAGYRAVPVASEARDGDDRYERRRNTVISGLPGLRSDN